MAFEDFQAFVGKMDGIYGKFRDTSTVEEKGLDPTVPEAAKKQGGYLIAFRHRKEIGERVEDFSQRVNNVTRVVMYGRENVHTTISDYRVGEDFHADTGVLDELSVVARGALPLPKLAKVEFGDWLFNQNTGIAAAGLNLNFFYGIQRIIKSAKERGIELREPWGAHMTVCRFLKAGKEKVPELLSMFAHESPLGESFPIAVDVGYFSFSPKGFPFTTHERFEM